MNLPVIIISSPLSTLNPKLAGIKFNLSDVDDNTTVKCVPK
jgi:hypothetical protein